MGSYRLQNPKSTDSAGRISPPAAAEKTRSSSTTDEHSHSQDHAHDHSHDHAHEHSHGLSSFLSGHHHHHHDNPLLTEQKGGFKNPGVRITWIGLGVNVVMTASKAIGGIIFHSQVLLADAVHSASDMVSDLLTLGTVSLGAHKSSALFPYGYGKVETLGSLGVSALLLFAGLSMGWNGAVSIAHNLFGDLGMLEVLVGHGHSHSHSTVSADKQTLESSMNALSLALASVAVKEWLFRKTMSIANQTGSSVLVANAWHHRIDSMTSIVSVLAIGGAYLLDVVWIDALGGVIVSYLVVRTGWSTFKDSVMELAGSTASIDAEMQQLKTDMTEESLHEVLKSLDLDAKHFELSKLELIPSGPNYTAVAYLSAQRETSFLQFGTVANMLEESLRRRDPKCKKLTVTPMVSGSGH